MHFWLTIVGINEPNNQIKITKCEQHAASISAIETITKQTKNQPQRKMA